MIRLATGSTWGITDTQFLCFYGVMCAAAATTIWHRWRGALGVKARKQDPQPDLGIYRLAMLGGGPQLAITTAATKLHRDGLLKNGDAKGTLVAAGVLPAGADRLERAVFDTVHHAPGLTVDTLREELAGSDEVSWMRTDLTGKGLLLGDDQTRALKRLWLIGAALEALGVAWIIAGEMSDASVMYLAIMVAVVAWATVWLLRNRPVATDRGRAILDRARAERTDLHRTPFAGESALAVALYGGGALWLADPAFASTLGVPREDGRGSGNGGGGAGGCSAGGGGCGFGGGGSGDGGGGGGGGGGCGGGGGGCGGGGG